MKLTHFSIACAALSMPVAALADTTTPTAATAAATSATSTAKAPERTHLVCKTLQETGSLIAKKKVCMTAADWKQKAFASGQWLEHQTTYNSQPNGR